MSRPWARPCAAAALRRSTPVTASLPMLLISPTSPYCFGVWLDVQHLELDRRDDLRGAPHQDAADGGEAEGPGAERRRPVQRGDHDREGHDLDQIGNDRG